MHQTVKDRITLYTAKKKQWSRLSEQLQTRRGNQEREGEGWQTFHILLLITQPVSLVTTRNAPSRFPAFHQTPSPRLSTKLALCQAPGVYCLHHSVINQAGL